MADRSHEELRWIEDSLAAIVAGLLVGLTQLQAGCLEIQILATIPCFARMIAADFWRRTSMSLLALTTTLAVVPHSFLLTYWPVLAPQLIFTITFLVFCGGTIRRIGTATWPNLFSLFILGLPFWLSLRGCELNRVVVLAPNTSFAVTALIGSENEQHSRPPTFETGLRLFWYANNTLLGLAQSRMTSAASGICRLGQVMCKMPRMPERYLIPPLRSPPNLKSSRSGFY